MFTYLLFAADPVILKCIALYIFIKTLCCCLPPMMLIIHLRLIFNLSNSCNCKTCQEWRLNREGNIVL